MNQPATTGATKEMTALERELDRYSQCLEQLELISRRIRSIKERLLGASDENEMGADAISRDGLIGSMNDKNDSFGALCTKIIDDISALETI